MATPHAASALLDEPFSKLLGQCFKAAEELLDRHEHAAHVNVEAVVPDSGDGKW